MIHILGHADQNVYWSFVNTTGHTPAKIVYAKTPKRTVRKVRKSLNKKDIPRFSEPDYCL